MQPISARCGESLGNRNVALYFIAVKAGNDAEKKGPRVGVR